MQEKIKDFLRAWAKKSKRSYCALRDSRRSSRLQSFARKYAFSCEHGRPQKFFQGCNVDIVLILFSLLWIQCKWTGTEFARKL